MKNFKRKEVKGFTIIELVVVIAVIAILAAVLIPTFSNLVKKANMSADMQVVKNMNTALTTDEIINGKPSTVVEAQEVLIANGISNFKTHDNNNQYYWLGSDNRVILWDKVEFEVTYPEEYAKKFKGVDEVSSAWSLLDQEYTIEEVTPEEGKDLKTALLDEVKAAEDGTIIKLPENSTLQLAQGGLFWLGQALNRENLEAAKVTIDLNGATIKSDGTNASYTKTEDGTGWQFDSDGDYQMNILSVPANGELILANGTIDIDHGNQPSLSCFSADSGSKLVIRNMNITTTTAGILPEGDASEVVVENSKITAANYPIGTNRAESNNVRIIINNSELTATSSTALLINAPSYTHIYNSTITGVVHALVVRAGTVDIENSTLKTTDTEPGIYSYKDFAKGYNFKSWWGTGNTLPAGTIVLGDYAKANSNGSYSYSGDVICTMSNVKLESASSSEVPEVLLASSDASKTVSLTYSDDCSTGAIKLYGEDWTPASDSDNVEVTIQNVGNIVVNGTKK